MRIKVPFVVIAFVSLVGSAALAAAPDIEKAVMIPLDQIWAYKMPGTKDIQRLDPNPRSVFVGEIRQALKPTAKRKNAGKAFAIAGTDLAALRAFHAVLVKGGSVKETFSPNSPIHVAFYSYQDGLYIHLSRVERQGGTVNIFWRPVPHETKEATEHFALIPLGKLPSGRYQVNIIQLPLSNESIDAGFHPVGNKVAEQTVCKSFSFNVTDQEE
jgi:hypothetical protein